MDAATRFRALFEAHYPAVRRYAHHRAVVGADADDLVAETFTVAWRRLDDVPVDDPLPWLLAVAANVRRNQARSVRRYHAVLDRLPGPDPAPPPPEPGDAALAGALAALTPDDREILRLVAWDGLTPAQAARVLGCPDGTARARLHRARRRLAEHLAAAEGTGARAATAAAGPPPAAGRAAGQRPPAAGQFVADGTHTKEHPHEQVG
ncbi:MAG TPA: sigma-70 family RNA polymerase sigma factor [Acidimicrobiales bacterium]|nr:sigma-70 family RNA polymerase sigma factor [Acidimicrobiales bacterium]